VLEDAACALGARIGDVHVGRLGDAGCFSFHPRKSITTGEGGMLVTADAVLARLARSLRDNGVSRSDHQRHTGREAFRLPQIEQLGFNYRMTDLQGALGCAQMTRLEWILSERARQAAFYEHALGDLPWLRTPQCRSGQIHGWQAYVCLYAPEDPTPANIRRLHEDRDRLMSALEEEGIATRAGTLSPACTALYSTRHGLHAEQFPNAHFAESLSIALPLFAGLADHEIERVAETIRRIGP
jgi:dTDP-4-amino-4,6-dideoxygalactose transaminase